MEPKNIKYGQQLYQGIILKCRLTDLANVNGHRTQTSCVTLFRTDDVGGKKKVGGDLATGSPTVLATYIDITM